MERNRDLRIATTSAVNGLSRRRQRITSLKDSTEEDKEMELHEAVRLRDRERSQKKEFPKRRRFERYAMQQRNGGEGNRENESTDASDEEYREDEDDARIHFVDRLNQPSLQQSSSLSHNRRSLRTLRSSPLLRASVDETIGVPIPRRARSTSIKRLHDYCNSSNGKLGEDFIHRKFSSSPATASQICADGESPSYSGASMRKKMKSVEPRGHALKITCNPRPSSDVQDDIEIEVVEALFDLMKQSQSFSQSSKNQEKFDKDSVNAADEGLTKGVKDENKTILLRFGTSIKVDPETAMDDSMEEMKKDEGIEKEKFPNDSAPHHGDGFLNIEKVSPKESESPSRVKVDEVQDPKVTRADDNAIVVETKKEAKLEFDLMVPPPLASSSGEDVLADMTHLTKYMAPDVQKKSETISNDGRLREINHFPKFDLEKLYRKQQQRGQKEQKSPLQTSLSPFQISLGVLPHPGYMQSQQAVLPMDDSARSLFAMQPPKFTLSQPRPKISATHKYIALSIQQHQQLITKSLWSGQNLGAITGGSGNDKGSEVPSALNSTKTKELMLQQVSLHTSANNFPHNPAFIFPLGHHQTTVMAPAKSSGPPQSASASGNMSLRSNLAEGPSVNLSLPGEEVVPSFINPNLASNEVTPYMAVLQNNGYQFPISTNMAMPQLRGVQSPPLPLYNSSVYSSTKCQKLSSSNVVDNNYYRSLAFENSAQTEKQRFPPSHLSRKSPPEIGMKDSALYADTHQRSTENRVEHTPQPFAMSFGLNVSSWPPLNFSSMAQNSATFPVLPGMAWNGYQITKQNNFETSEGKNAIGSRKIDDGLEGILGKSENHGRKSSSKPFPPPSVAQASVVFPNLHPHQQQSIQLQKHHYMQQMQQTGRAKINASTANMVPGSFHWQNLPRSAAPEALSQYANLSVLNTPRPISSFGSHSVSAASLQGEIVANKKPVLAVGSTYDDSSISKNARTASDDVNADSTISALPSQQIEASLNGPNQKSSPACRGNVASILNTCPGQLSELKY